MDNFENILELAANFAELLAGLVIIFSVIKVWPMFNSLAKSTVEKQDFSKEFNDIHRGLSQRGKCDPISSVAQVAERILETCLLINVSDIHIDLHPKDGEVRGRIRYRENGVLATVCDYNENFHRALMAEFRNLAGVELDVAGVVTGRMQIVHTGAPHPIDFRIDFAPANLGEVVTVRILDPRSARLGFEPLGIPIHDLSRIKHVLSQRRGMIVFSGPIGSGKTVSLYSSVNSLDWESRKVTTVEDPMEIELPHVTQLPVFDLPGHRFGDLFPAALRADPDVLLIGEIRDEVTARACVRAHANILLLTTMTGHSAIDTLERLYRLNQDIDFYNLLIMNQRLARRLCQNCAKPHTLSSDDTAYIHNICGFNMQDIERLPTKFLEANGCEECDSGYLGRVGGYETIIVTPEMIRLLKDGQPTHVLWKHAIEGGTQTIQYNLLSRAAEGKSTLDEIRRVTDNTYYV